MRFGTLGGALLAAALSSVCSSTADAATRWTHELTRNAGNWNAGAYPRMLADVNGDGLADLVGYGHYNVYVALSTGASFAPAEVWYGSGFGPLAGWSTTHYLRTTGDVDGDGRADLVGFGHDYVFVALSTGTGFGPAQRWNRELVYTTGWRPEQHERVTGDVNGDGRDDVVGFGSSKTFVLLSQGDGFESAQVWSHHFASSEGWQPHRHSRQLGDVDGDGLADVVGFGYHGVWVMRSQGDGFGTPYLTAPEMGELGSGPSSAVPRAVGDVDGDGLADVIAFRDDGVRVALSDGHGFGPPRMWLDTFGRHSGYAQHHVRAMADVDGNGQIDAVAFTDGEVRVAAAVGDRFDNRFRPLADGDFVTRFVSSIDGKCLTTRGGAPVQYGCERDVPLGWTLGVRGDGAHDIAQDGACLSIAADGAVEASAAACGQADGGWRVERDRTARVRIRHRDSGRCLRVGPTGTGDGARIEAAPCDASDFQVWSAASLRPRTMTTALRLADTTLCLSADPAVGGVVECDDGLAQDLTLIDDGHGGYQIRDAASGRCFADLPHLDAHVALPMACDVGAPDQRFALLARADGRRQLVGRASGLCLAQRDGTAVPAMMPCADHPQQRWTLPEMQATGAIEYSLQNVGSEDGALLVAAYETGAFVSRDPAAIVTVARRMGLIATEVDFRALLDIEQQLEFESRYQRWDADLPEPLVAEAELLSVSAEYDVGLDGAHLEAEATAFRGRFEIAGVNYAEARVLSADATMTMRNDGVALGASADIVAVDSGWGDEDGSYFGGGVGLGQGLSVGARWGQDGQWGVTFPYSFVTFEIYVAEDDVLAAAAFAGDVGLWTSRATVDAFSSAHGWTAGAFGTVVGAVAGLADTLGDVADDIGGAVGEAADAVEDVVDDVGGVFCGIFGC